MKHFLLLATTAALALPPCTANAQQHPKPEPRIRDIYFSERLSKTRPAPKRPDCEELRNELRHPATTDPALRAALRHEAQNQSCNPDAPPSQPQTSPRP